MSKHAEETAARDLHKVLMSKNLEILKSLEGTDEPYFVLRAQDAFASRLVYEWARLSESGGSPPEATRRAIRIAGTMALWRPKKIPD